MKLKNTRIAILGVLFCAGSVVRAEDTKNLVANGGFETQVAGNQAPERWHSKLGTCSDEQKHSGKYSLKIPVLAGDEKKHIAAEYSFNASQFKPGDEVDFSVYAMSTAKLGPDSTSRASLAFADAYWYPKTNVTLRLPGDPTAEWKQFSGKVIVPAEISADWRVRVVISVNVGAKPETAGAIYLDDVQVTAHPAAKP